MAIQDTSRAEYIFRINRVMEYVDEHYNEPVNLSKMAEVAHFSTYHFHRIFTVLTGETPGEFFLRIRTERAAQQIRDFQEKSISEIAFDCGFSSMPLFSRTFRKHFGMNAKAYRKLKQPLFVKNGIYYSKNGQPLSKKGQVYIPLNNELCSVNLKEIIIMETKIVVKEMPDMQVVYCRHIGAFDKIDKAYKKLRKFAVQRGLLKPDSRMLTLYHDDPSVTEIDKVRQSACLIIGEDEDVRPEGEIGKMTIKSGKYAVGHFEINEKGFEDAWNTMCVWFSESGYEPGDGFTYEYYYSVTGEHPEHRFSLDICIPVKIL